MLSSFVFNDKTKQSLTASMKRIDKSQYTMQYSAVLHTLSTLIDYSAENESGVLKADTIVLLYLRAITNDCRVYQFSKADKQLIKNSLGVLINLDCVKLKRLDKTRFTYVLNEEKINHFLNSPLLAAKKKQQISNSTSTMLTLEQSKAVTKGIGFKSSERIKIHKHTPTKKTGR